MTKLKIKDRSAAIICAECVLPESFPGIVLNDKGICNFCLTLKKRNGLEKRRKEIKEKFEKLLRENRGKAAYDALLSYSGGKDSTYTLSLLKEDYGLNVLAFSVDNGFVPEETYSNTRTVCEKLGVDHLWLKPSFRMLGKIFREAAKRNIYSPTALMRASTICTACLTIVRFSAIRFALEKRIPFLVFGWSPGQIPLSASVLKNNPETIRAMRAAGLVPLRAIAGDALLPYYLEEELLREAGRRPFYSISPLAFLDYEEKNIRQRITELGWKEPAGLDANSTNCLLNSFANIIHQKSHGYHPYAFELASLVREGYLRRSEALDRLRQPGDQKTIRWVERKLGL
jgi:tRNA(Ile)-lysidine synthase TilS/MesJ